jgi:hypothetical protein
MKVTIYMEAEVEDINSFNGTREETLQNVADLFHGALVCNTSEKLAMAYMNPAKDDAIQTALINTYEDDNTLVKRLWANAKIEVIQSTPVEI